MKKKTEKTPDTRARELFKMVYPHSTNSAFDFGIDQGSWLKLGKFVLDLEKKWTNAKKGKRNAKH